MLRAVDWRDPLRKRGDRFLGDEANVISALRSAPDLAGLVRWNLFAGAVEFGRRCPWRNNLLGERWTDTDDVELTAYLQQQGLDVRGQAVVAAAVQVASHDDEQHPVRQYLDGLRWDGDPRLQLWLPEHLDARGPVDYLAAIGRRFMVSAVARIFEPGCQADHVLVLEGPQGCGKSRTVQILGQPWTTDSLPDLHSKDAAVQLAGVWLMELAELAALRRTSDVEAAKAFITRRVDRYRPPYGRLAVDVPRQCVFIASTNEAQYLRDSTGNRRFWPVRVGGVNFEALAADRDQLWAEAVHLYRNGEAWHLTGEEILAAQSEQALRTLVTELESAVAEYLDRLESQGITEVSSRQVLTQALGLDPGRSDFMERAGRLGAQAYHAMRRCGWHRVGEIGRRGAGGNHRVIYRKADAARGVTWEK